MRKIKFRGKVKWNGNHKFSGDWVYGYYRNNDNGNAFITETVDDFDNYIFDETEIDENTVGQYTGIKDRHGKEIYEGDILKYNDEIIVKVKWKEKLSYFMIQPIQNRIFYNEILGSVSIYNCIEVIGNIYDNPELLEEGE